LREAINVVLLVPFDFAMVVGANCLSLVDVSLGFVKNLKESRLICADVQVLCRVLLNGPMQIFFVIFIQQKIELKSDLNLFVFLVILNLEKLAAKLFV
jgi:hypothetical protein